MDKYREWALGQMGKEVQRHTSAGTLDDLCNPYGCTGWADPCGDNDIVSLSMCGPDKLLDALGWLPTDVCRHVYKYLSWVACEELAGTVRCTPTTPPPPPAGIMTDCCGPRPGISYGICEYEVNDFGHLGRTGGELCIYDDGLKQCESQAMVRLNGQRITSNFEWRANMAAQVILQDLKWMLQYGDGAVAGQFDGLQKLIGVGFADYKGNRCEALDGVCVDWNGGCYNETDAQWLDGRSDACGPLDIPAGTSIIDVVKWILRNFRQRISMTGGMQSQRVQAGDVFLAANSNQIECLLDCYVCHKFCGAAGTSCFETMAKREAKQDRDESGIGNGFYDDGVLMLDGFPLPIVRADWLDDTIYILTRKVGNQWALFGEHQNMNSIDLRSLDGEGFMPTDGGRFMNYKNRKETCVEHVVDWRGRLQAPGRFLQAKITGFECDIPKVIPGCDPYNSMAFVNPTLDPSSCA